MREEGRNNQRYGSFGGLKDSSILRIGVILLHAVAYFTTADAFRSNALRCTKREKPILFAKDDDSSKDVVPPPVRIDFQSDFPKFARGDRHLSASLCEGDLVVYRTGSWYVDGVLVGDADAIPTYELCVVDTIQVVWTHNCEHGFLRGLAIKHASTDTSTCFTMTEPLEDVEFGPEQLVARISGVEWKASDDETTGQQWNSPVPLETSLWEEHDGNNEQNA